MYRAFSTWTKNGFMSLVEKVTILNQPPNVIYNDLKLGILILKAMLKSETNCVDVAAKN